MSVPFGKQWQLKSKSISTMPTRAVKVSNLGATQATYDEAKIEKMANKEPSEFNTVPVVAKVPGGYRVLDGHHRVAAAMLRGDDKVSVRISR
jgi:hypothetical protein